MKQILLLPLLPLLFMNSPYSKMETISVSNNEYLTLTLLSDNKHYAVTGIDSEYLDRDNYRIYSSYNSNHGDDQIVSISQISSHVFSSCTSTSISLMISNGITVIEEDALENISEIHFTGSEEEWNEYSLTFNGNVSFYEYDEGFINYWDEYVRPNSSSDICDIGKSAYLTLKNKYNSLLSNDRIVVDAYKDKAGQTIRSSMLYLADYFNSSNNSNGSQTTLNQDTTIGLIVSIAIFGMTTISIFYLLKRKNIIS